METKSQILLLCFLSYFVFLNAQNHLETYIVQLHPQGLTRPSFSSKLHWHLSFVEKAILSEDDSSSRLLYSYQSAMEGFAARLSKLELEALRQTPDVIAIRPERRFELQTTYSFKFLGLDPTGNGNAAMLKYSGFGHGAIVGVLDTGIWPESPSFKDDGMPPVPKKWRGICQQGEDFNSSSCNRKLIGARIFTRGNLAATSKSSSTNDMMEYASPRDARGHGTHTASTAAGSSVEMASVFGNGAGAARGMAPGVHIAVYKFCWFDGCYSSDILAAMDLATEMGWMYSPFH